MKPLKVLSKEVRNYTYGEGVRVMFVDIDTDNEDGNYYFGTIFNNHPYFIDLKAAIKGDHFMTTAMITNRQFDEVYIKILKLKKLEKE